MFLLQFPLAIVFVYITHWSSVLQAVFLYTMMLHTMMYSITETEECRLAELGIEMIVTLQNSFLKLS